MGGSLSSVSEVASDYQDMFTNLPADVRSLVLMYLDAKTLSMLQQIYSKKLNSQITRIYKTPDPSPNVNEYNLYLVKIRLEDRRNQSTIAQIWDIKNLENYPTIRELCYPIRITDWTELNHPRLSTMSSMTLILSSTLDMASSIGTIQNKYHDELERMCISRIDCLSVFQTLIKNNSLSEKEIIVIQENGPINGSSLFLLLRQKHFYLSYQKREGKTTLKFNLGLISILGYDLHPLISSMFHDSRLSSLIRDFGHIDRLELYNMNGEGSLTSMAYSALLDALTPSELAYDRTLNANEIADLCIALNGRIIELSVLP